MRMFKDCPVDVGASPIALLISRSEMGEPNIYLRSFWLIKMPRNDTINAHVSHPLSLDAGQDTPSPSMQSLLDDAQ